MANTDPVRRDDLVENRTSVLPPSLPREDAPLGERLRAIINPALEDSRRHELQYSMVNDFFTAMAEELEPLLQKRLRSFFNDVAKADQRAPEKRNLLVIEQLTSPDGVQTNLRMGIPLNNQFLELSADDIRDMPGYIKLHTAARDLNIAIGLSGMTMDETKSAQVPQPVLSVNMAKSYEDGAVENVGLYPNLPPVKATFDRKSAEDFVL